ncbi:type IA DNA topoisomerase [Klebsiella quasipneumoniae]|uniref:type IA DNA topoisomerase n=1 Tax=Klebsiella quasipneumoniae TaxID=1463165 RepID=UPI001C9551C3|nr:type IA DNA topoisomerase [Klebsiella quasipneumoniae]MBY5246580.1 DNA topoisomerase III [Klebsiella quasipneumoniae]
MRLFIAEKPSVAGDIASALDGNFTRKEGYYESDNAVVTWCIGHILESVPPESYNPAYKQWSLSTLPLKMFPLKYQKKPTTAKQADIVISLLKRADIKTVIHAGDPDDEGQLLVEEVLEYAGNQKPVQRLLINDNTLPAIKKALQNIRDNRQYRGLYYKALARSAGDAIYGFSMTRAYTIPAQEKGYKGVLSVGRVQTPVLGLIVTRFRENRDHKSSFYYNLHGQFTSSAATSNFSARWRPSEYAPLDEKRRLIDKNYASGLANALKGKDAHVLAAATDHKETAAPLPFNLARLQQHMNRTRKMSAQKTLDVTQSLREKHRAITYNRSDCSYLSEEQFAEAPAILRALEKTHPQPLDIDASRKSKAFNTANVTAHTAIIPTVKVPELASLTEDEKAVYLAIADYFIAQFLPKKTYQEASAEICCGDESFTARATRQTNPGFTVLLSDAEDENEEANDVSQSDFDSLTKLKPGTALVCTEIQVDEVKTKPPALFTEAGLIAALVRVADFVTDPEIKKLLKEKDKDKKNEHGGIGTPATRSGIIETLKRRNFITTEKGKLIPTPAGIALIESLPPVATRPDMTAFWSEKQNQIENGELSVEAFIDSLYSDLSTLVEKTDIEGLKIEPASQAGKLERLSAVCPSCGSEIAVTPKRYSCSGCRFGIWNEVAGKKLTLNQVSKLINDGKTGNIKGFKSKAGKSFDTYLVLKDKKTGQIGFGFNEK